MTNRKLHMRFQLTPRSMTLDDHELCKFEFSENFSGFRRFRTQQQLNVFHPDILRGSPEREPQTRVGLEVYW